jgi:hypothetical protein
MRTLLVVAVAGLVAAVIGSSPAAGQQPGWSDLLGRNLKDWTRLGDSKPNPWRLTSGQSLACAAATDTMAPEMDFRDGTLKFDFRFTPTKFKTGYQASVTARWNRGYPGCKVDLGDDCGTITGAFVAASDSYKEVTIKAPAKYARPIGEWNQVKLVCKDTTVFVVVNDREVGSFERCMQNHGTFLFSSEGSEVEFRNIHWRAGK